jgi:hypothetical protein
MLKKLCEPHFPLFIHGHKIHIFSLMPFRAREGMDVGVRSSNDMYDPIGQGVGNIGCPAKSSMKGGYPSLYRS